MQFFLQPLPGGLSGVTFDSVEDLLLAVKDGNGTKLTWETSVSVAAVWAWRINPCRTPRLPRPPRPFRPPRPLRPSIHWQPLPLLTRLNTSSARRLTAEGCSNTSTAAATLYSQLHQHNLIRRSSSSAAVSRRRRRERGTGEHGPGATAELSWDNKDDKKDDACA
jgi:hypothetical protein